MRFSSAPSVRKVVVRTRLGSVSEFGVVGDRMVVVRTRLGSVNEFGASAISADVVGSGLPGVCRLASTITTASSTTEAAAAMSDPRNESTLIVLRSNGVSMHGKAIMI